MRLEEAMEIVLNAVRAPGGQPRTADQAQDIEEAADVVEAFKVKVRAICDGDEDDEYDIEGEEWKR